MVTRYNPSVHQAPRYQAIPIIPLTETESLLNWLKRTGRLKPRDVNSSEEIEIPEDLEDIIDNHLHNLEEEE